MNIFNFFCNEMIFPSFVITCKEKKNLDKVTLYKFILDCKNVDT